MPCESTNQTFEEQCDEILQVAQKYVLFVFSAQTLHKA